MIIVDLDNCIADDHWRIPLIRWDEPNGFIRFHTYHMSLVGDQPANLHVLSDRYLITIFTSRPQRYEVLTREWLHRHKIHYDHLYMRREGDQRISSLVKQDMLVTLVKQNAPSIVCAFDDRQDVVDMYQREGLQAEVLAIHPTILVERTS